MKKITSYNCTFRTHMARAMSLKTFLNVEACCNTSFTSSSSHKKHVYKGQTTFVVGHSKVKIGSRG